MSREKSHALCIHAGKFRLAFYLDQVVRVVQSAEVMPLPGAGELFFGVIDYHGQILAVINTYMLFGITQVPIKPSMVFIVVKTPNRDLVFVADRVEGIIPTFHTDIVKASELDVRMGQTGLLRTKDGLVIIYDLDLFLNTADEALLNQLMVGVAKIVSDESAG